MGVCTLRTRAPAGELLDVCAAARACVPCTHDTYYEGGGGNVVGGGSPLMHPAAGEWTGDDDAAVGET